MMQIRTALLSQKPKLPHGLWRAVRLLKHEIDAVRLHRRGVKKAKAYSGHTGLKLNIGCGFNHKPGWVNIDLAPNVDLCLDLREKIPLPTHSCTIIYSEHFLEHLEYSDARRFIVDCHRLLAPGGCFSVGVPDTLWPLREYAGLGDGEWFQFAKDLWHPKSCHTKLEHINQHFRQYSDDAPEYDYHRYAYDFETLSRLLEDCGYGQIKQREFDPKLDSEHRKLGTLYVEAFTPQCN